ALEQAAADPAAPPRRLDVEEPQHQACMPRLVLDGCEAANAAIVRHPACGPPRPPGEHLPPPIALCGWLLEPPLEELDAARRRHQVEHGLGLERGVDRLDTAPVGGAVELAEGDRHGRPQAYASTSRLGSGRGTIATSHRTRSPGRFAPL